MNRPALLAALTLAAATTVAAADLAPDVRDESVAHVRTAVAAGYLAEKEIVEQATELFGEEADEKAVRGFVRESATAAFKAHGEAEKSWPAVTDYDRLRTAFRALERDAIVARENFTCCQTCGSDEIRGEVEKFKGGPAKGYAFFHQQDTERAVTSGGLYLAYGATADSEAAALDVARRIVKAFEDAGLAVEWDGSWNRRILVKLNWQRRRPRA